MNYIKTIILITIFTIAFSFNFFGQRNTSESIFISGIVMEKDSLNTLPETNILINHTSGSISDSEGYFSFLINKKDTLLFSRVGFRNYKFIIPDTLNENEYVVGIVMSQDTMMLGEIIIYPRVNQRQLKSDFINYNNIDKNTANAEKNLKIATYQSLAYDQPNDAVANQKISLGQQSTQTEYKGLIAPDKMLSVTAVIPLAFAIAQKRTIIAKSNKFKISIHEEESLRKEYWNRVHKARIGK